MKRPKFTICETNYIVNKDKGTIVCIIKFKVPSYYDYLVGTDYHIENCFKKAGLPTDLPHNRVKIVKGVAKCSPNDTFDETIGKRIAESKAKISLFKTANKLCHLLDFYYMDIVYDMQRYTTDYWNLLQKEEQHLRELSK